MKFNKLLLVFMILNYGLTLSAQTNKTSDKQDILRAGIAKIDITPGHPVLLYGYSSRTALSEGVLDPLSARAIVFENSNKKVVLVSTDIGSYGGEVFTVMQKSIMDKFSLKESELFLSTIHSHASPILTLNKEKGDPANIRYTESLNQKLLTVIGEAFKNLRPVQTGIGTGCCPVGINRREMKPDGSIAIGRDPYGPADKEVLVMKIATADGTPLGAVYDYATHATCLGYRNLRISGDVMGVSAQFVEKILGRNVIAPVFAGASGNINPWLRVQPDMNMGPDWILEHVLLGTFLGEEVVHVFRNIKELSPYGRISTAFATLECPRWIKEENKEQPADQKETIPVNITAARIGDDVVFIGFNVEMLTEIGMEIKSGSPFKHTFIITHCNGSSGYLPPAGLYKEGGYEITSTRFKIGSAEMVVKKALRMLYDLK